MMQSGNTDHKGKLSAGMFLVALGIVYGDIGTSPMYVMKSIVEGNGGIANVDQEFIIGSLSLVMDHHPADHGEARADRPAGGQP